MGKNNIERRGLVIDMSSIIRRLTKEGLYIVLLAMIIAMLFGIVTTFSRNVTFTTQTTLAVSQRQSIGYYYRQGTATEAAKSIQEVIDMGLFQKKVAKKMKLDRLPGTVSCSQIEGTNLIVFKVVSDSPKNAVTVMKGVLENYDSAMDNLIGKYALTILDSMNTPTPSRTPIDDWLSILKVFIGSLIGIIVIVSLYDLLKDDIKNEDEVEKKLDTKLFGTVFYEKLNTGVKNRLTGARNIGLTINNPAISFGFTETYQKIATKVEYMMGNQDNKDIIDKQVLMITSISENEGKSTVAANIALTLAQREKSVILVDADFRKPAQYKLLGLSYPDEYKQACDFFTGNATFDESAVYDKDTRLTILAGDKSFQETNDLMILQRMKDNFQELKEEYDYIIVDTPPLFVSVDTEEFLNVCDAGILVVSQNGSQVRDINDGIDIFRTSKCKLLGCILNGVRTKGVEITSNYDRSYNRHYGYSYGNYGHRNQYNYRKRPSNDRQRLRNKGEE